MVRPDEKGRRQWLVSSSAIPKKTNCC